MLVKEEIVKTVFPHLLLFVGVVDQCLSVLVSD